MVRGMYWTCEHGANHDYGENCDCYKEEMKKREFYEKHLKVERKVGQLAFVFDSREDCGHESKSYH